MSRNFYYIRPAITLSCHVPEPRLLKTRKPQDGILPFLTSQIVPAVVALMVVVSIMPALMKKPCSKKPDA